MNVRARYEQLLREAHESSEQVDHFDLHSEDPKSVKHFKRLRAEDRRQRGRLITHILHHYRALTKDF